MNGVVFKELRGNFSSFLGCFIITLVFGLIMLMLFFIQNAEIVPADFVGDGSAGMTGFRAMWLIFSYWITGMLAGNFFKTDELKKWGYFIASTPKGVTGQIYGKYAAMFIYTGLNFITNVFADSIFCFYIYCKTGQTPTSLINLLITMLFLQLLLRAIEAPFYVRFSSKYGESARLCVLLFFMLIGAVYGLFGPLPVNSTDSITEFTANALEQFMQGELPDVLIFLAALFPVISCAAYYLSFRISCASYLKGVELYEK